MKKDQSTEEKILSAARKVFEKKGMTGARMQEIADEAKINKALLHYYFRSKEKLFEKVLQETLEEALPILGRILNEDIPVFEKIERYVNGHLSILQKNEYLPAFVIHELNRDPQKLLKFTKHLEHKPNPLIFFQQIEREIKKGNIRRIRPEHLMANMLAMCVFPFLIQPMLVKGLGFDKKYFDQLIEERKKEIPLFIINAIKK
jgi:AcrR family transcriptional regulator